jgi:aspartate kinase
MKFGGTSVATTALMDRIADRVLALKQAGHEVLLVVSAMGHETDRLVDLAAQIDYSALEGRQELDVLLATGEQVSISLLALSLMKKGVPARSFQGH